MSAPLTQSERVCFSGALELGSTLSYVYPDTRARPSYYQAALLTVTSSDLGNGVLCSDSTGPEFCTIWLMSP